MARIKVLDNPETKRLWIEKISKANKGHIAWNKNLAWSQKIKDKISKSKKGKRCSPATEFKKGEPSIFKGKHHTEESKAKNRQTHLGKHYSPATEFKKGDLKLIGSNNCNWHNGASFELYGRKFNNKLKEQIRERGLYICQLCSSPQNGRKLDIHHIDYDKKNNDATNLIPLCLKCHRLTNHNRDYWTEKFQK